ncbi:CxxH/CxxC protein [Effusibacillus dendaii]|uniref:CxxH/CxxC protein n=1 Tax=Effusibacillus dendaii TaxID=2743772 RepID=A0A7I8DBR6_9BACL|nr:CxxH/CxxC protein [Effusibacillus dendaii]BCJ87534.1 hypothetical protein skT53_25190 [Effusibacillus dendaii]
MFTACEEHIDMAIDEFIFTYEEPPELRLIEELSVADDLHSKCQFCGAPTKYIVTKEVE